MKRRQAFVANSSSSSFLISVDRIPMCLEEAGEVFFGDQKDFFAPVIIEGLYDGLKEFPLDFNKLLTYAETLKQINGVNEQFPYNDDEHNLFDNEAYILSQLSSNFQYEEEYGCKEYLRSDEPSKFEQYRDKWLGKLRDKKYPEMKNLHQIPWHEKRLIEERYFRLKHVRSSWVEYVYVFIKEMQGYRQVKNTIFMYGNFSDETNLGSRLEHGDHWEIFSSKIRFSHH